MSAKYFGTDGFRGRAGVTITAEHAFKVGRFLGWYYTAKGGKCRVVIGKDPRLSSYTLEYSIAAGITASGGDAYVLHVTTTASVAFITRTDGFDCGVMISASHNDYLDNGIKLLNSRGEKLERGVLNLIEDYIDGRLFIGGEPFSIPMATGDKVGRTVDYVAGRNRYIGHLISLSACSFKGLKVGLDCANGSGYKIAKSVFNALGATVVSIGDAPDGVNVNVKCGSTDTAALVRLVRENALNVGFAFDGDADRCICVDERGKVVDGDGVLYILAKYLKSRGELIGDRIVATVMSNGGLVDSLLKEGIGVETCAVGDSCVYEAMSECGAVLGGEQSGHVILGKIESTGDGIVTALMIAEVMVERGAALSALAHGLVRRPQLTVSIKVKDKARVLACGAVTAAVDRARGELKDCGRLIFRASGTEEAVRVTVEAREQETCLRLCRQIENAVKRCGEE